MCGVFGFISTQQQDAPQHVFDGLKSLEYRGYDSWGIAWNEPDKCHELKLVGKMPSPAPQLPLSSIAIGHTRWATHGGVTQDNAHPHLDCHQRLALVHNGIVENFTELKEALLAKNHTFKSETDSEVLVHLIEELMKESRTLTEAVQKAFLQAKGLNAIVVLDHHTQTVCIVKNGSPLLIGKADNAWIMASDIPAILAHTTAISRLEDRTLVTFHNSEMKAMNADTGKSIKLEFQQITGLNTHADKGEYDHFMLKEIHEQQTVLQQYVEELSPVQTEFFSQQLLGQAPVLIGCGTAYHASLFGQYLLTPLYRQLVSAIPGGEASHFLKHLPKEQPFVFLSQSGETMDLIEIAKEQTGRPTAAMINRPFSSLEKIVGKTFPLLAGLEQCVLSTKSFTAKVATFLLWADKIEKSDRRRKDLRTVVEWLPSALSEEYHQKHIAPVVEVLKKVEHAFVLGQYEFFPIALETALKIKEGTYTHAEGFAGSELKHGVIALIEPGTPCIALAPDKKDSDIISHAREVQARGGTIIGISPFANELFEHYLPLPHAGSATPIASAIVGQLVAYHLALAKGIDPDKPRNLAKSVTVK